MRKQEGLKVSGGRGVVGFLATVFRIMFSYFYSYQDSGSK